MNQQYNLVDALKALIRWKIPIATFVAIAAVASIIVSLLLPNYYESRALFYPTNPAVNDRSAMFNQNGDISGLDYFGNKSSVSRFLTIASSESVLDYMINTYHLVQEYKIDTTKKDWRYSVKKELKSNFDVLKTENDAVEITFLDKDPVVAAEAVNSVMNLVDSLNKDLIIENKRKILTILEQKKNEKTKEVAELSDSLAALVNMYHITEIPSPGSGEPIVKSDNALVGETYKVLRSRRHASLVDLNDITTLFLQHQASDMEHISSIYVVEKAVPADRKSWPIRWLIVLGTTLVALFLGTVAALLVERFRDIKVQLNA